MSELPQEPNCMSSHDAAHVCDNIRQYIKDLKSAAEQRIVELIAEHAILSNEERRQRERAEELQADNEAHVRNIKKFMETVAQLQARIAAALAVSDSDAYIALQRVRECLTK
jgi:hypothetical protein